ncbi:hypothetical protein [Pseudomonas sp. YuFO20]
MKGSLDTFGPQFNIVTP